MHSAGRSLEIYRASKTESCNSLLEEQMTENIDGLYWEAQEGLSNRCRAMAEVEKPPFDIAEESKLPVRILEGMCCWILVSSLWVVRPM